MAAIIIRRSIAGRNIDQTQFFVSAHGCPTVGRAACELLAFRRHSVEVRSPRIESPGNSSSDGIIGADHAGWFADMLSVRYPSDRKSVVYGKSVSGRVDLGGSRNHKKKTTNSRYKENINIEYI